MKKWTSAIIIWAACLSAENTVDDYYQKAKECPDLLCVRKEIDRINVEILKLLAERTAYVQRAGDLKQNQAALDKKRIAEQEKFLVEQSEKLKLPIEITIPTFRAIVENSTKYEQCYIERHSLTLPN